MHFVPQNCPQPDRIARHCFDFFDTLPKTGKPNAATEWTVLSCIVQYNGLTNDMHVVALGTGTKCLPRCNLQATGEQINDCHAEVLARRAFKRYILAEMLMASADATKNSSSSLFEYNECTNRFQMATTGISFHFFSTHPPCGDGSIFPIANDIDDNDDVVKRIRLTDDDVDEQAETINIGVPIANFTGGKLLNDKCVDKMDQQIGPIRTKPGRGDRTASVSCSDKLARWNCMGIQGGLLHMLLVEPVLYLNSITICGRVDLAAIQRAVWLRFSGTNDEFRGSGRFVMQRPVVQAARQVSFAFGKSVERTQPAPGSMAWCRSGQRFVDNNYYGWKNKYILCSTFSADNWK